MTVVLLFFLLGFCLCSPLTMCLFRLKAELNVLEHSFHKYLSDTLTLFSLTKMPKPAADFTFLTWFSCDGFFSCVFTCLSYPNFDLNFVPHFSQSRDFFTLSGFSSCTCLLCLMTCDLCALSYGHFSHLCFLSRVLTAGLNIVAQIQVWHYFRIGLYLV